MGLVPGRFHHLQPIPAHLTALHARCSRVYGNSYENVLVAVVVPDKKALTAWAADNGLGNASFEELCDNSKVRTYACATVGACAASPVGQSI